MFNNVISLFVLIIFFINPLCSQTVSTLVNNPTMDFEAVHWHPDGRIFVTDYNNGRLYKVELDGSVETIVTGFSAIAGGGFDRDGNFYFAGINVGKMYRLNDDYSYEEVGSGFNQPVAFLQSTTDDNIAYISAYGSNSLHRLDLSTKESTLLASNQGINGPDGLLFDEDNNILIANFNNHRINRVEEDGTVSLFANVPSGGFMGYMAKYGDKIFVCSVTSKRIFRIDGNGDIVHIAGNGASGSADGNALNASFRRPNGIAINATGDSLLIADEKTIRVITNFGTTRVKEYNLELVDFVASPNPAQDVFEISYSYSESFDMSYEIINFEGKVVLPIQKRKSEVGDNLLSIDCSGLAKGLYFIRLMDNEGKIFTSNLLKV